MNRLTPNQPFTASGYNANIDAMELQAAFLHGRGVVYGLELSAGSDLDVEISAGALNALGVVEIEAVTHTCPDDATVYVWIDQDGDVVTSVDPDDPGGTMVCLGRVTTASGAVDDVDEVGRMRCLVQDGIRLRRLGDILVLDESEGLVTLAKGLVSGAFEVEGTLDAQGSVNIGGPAAFASAITLGVNEETLTADKTIPAGEAGVHVLTPSGANRKAVLPAPHYGRPLTIHNAATSGALEIIVRDPGDTATIATLAPGESTNLSAKVGPSGAAWPASAPVIPPL